MERANSHPRKIPNQRHHSSTRNPTSPSLSLLYFNQVLLVVDGVVRKYSIDNFALHNASSLVLYTTLRTGDAAPHSIVIKDRYAAVRTHHPPGTRTPSQASACNSWSLTQTPASNPDTNPSPSPNPPQ